MSNSDASATPVAVQVVVAIFFDGQRVLMGQRPADKKYPLQWEFPGGKVEHGESLEEALKREMHEELDVAIDGLHELRCDVSTYADSGTFAVHYFKVERWTGEFRNQAFNALEWVHPRDFGRYDILAGNSIICRQLADEIGV